VVEQWTTFQMTLREPGPIPAALDLTRFLTSSITFMTHLSEVSVYFDDIRLVRLSKNRGVSRVVPMLNGLEGTSFRRMMNVTSIETMRKFTATQKGFICTPSFTALYIEAEVVRSVYLVSSGKCSATSSPIL